MSVINQEQLRMIQLRYMGKTYQEVANTINREFNKTYTAANMRVRFSTSGSLYIAYHEYSNKEEEFAEEKVRARYKQMANWADKVVRDIVKLAMKKGDFATALRTIQDINDRAGVVVIRKSQIDVKDNKKTDLSDEEFSKELARFGIDSRTGIRVGTTEQTKN